MKFTRDSVLWTATLITSFCTFLLGQFDMLKMSFVFLSANPQTAQLWQSRLGLISGLAGMIAGFLKMSPLALSPQSTYSGAPADPTLTLNPLNSLTTKKD